MVHCDLFRNGLAKCDTFQKITGHDDKIMLIFEYLKQLEQTKQEELEQEPRKVIEGYFLHHIITIC